MVEQLIEMLIRIEENPLIKDFEDDCIPQNLPDVQQASYLAAEILISPYGHVLWDTVNQIRNSGYSVFPLEKDRFGWLIGGIATKKGTIAFG